MSELIAPSFSPSTDWKPNWSEQKKSILCSGWHKPPVALLSFPLA